MSLSPIPESIATIRRPDPSPQEAAKNGYGSQNFCRASCQQLIKSKPFEHYDLVGKIAEDALLWLPDYTAQSKCNKCRRNTTMFTVKIVLRLKILLKFKRY